MGCLWQPLNLTSWLLHNITFLKPGGLGIQKLHLKSMDCNVQLNFKNPVPANRLIKWCHLPQSNIIQNTGCIHAVTLLLFRPLQHGRPFRFCQVPLSSSSFSCLPLPVQHLFCRCPVFCMDHPWGEPIDFACKGCSDRQDCYIFVIHVSLQCESTTENMNIQKYFYWVKITESSNPSLFISKFDSFPWLVVKTKACEVCYIIPLIHWAIPC